MTDYEILDADQISEGDRVVVELEGREIGVFLLDGEYKAFLNWCAHQSGPICEGSLTGTREATFDRETLEIELSWDREGEILNCPWHGWEYDVDSGECLSRRNVTLPSYPVREEDDKIIVTL